MIFARQNQVCPIRSVGRIGQFSFVAGYPKFPIVRNRSDCYNTIEIGVEQCLV